MPQPLRQEYLVSYDIEDNKVRTMVYKECLKYGLQPVQKSVFWGYLTKAELLSINRYMHSSLGKNDKALITHSNLSRTGKCFLVGHTQSEFRDWSEADVI